ncbi:unnamed protein product [Nippostrongylus brasiliensis]|uniref:Uncharacterized protein n=1 Tax=Nippostrongylus brasiliensis TaxID=27835 RepID=A0A0N4YVI6_NIPBR|nr:unnamed protein product [Nippostrongylus brasiliensis]
MQNKMNSDFELLIRLMKEHGKVPSSSDESVDSVRPRRVVSISPGEIVRLPNGGDEMRCFHSAFTLVVRVLFLSY